MALPPCRRERTGTLLHRWKPVKCPFSGPRSRSQPRPCSMRSQRHAALRHEPRHGAVTPEHPPARRGVRGWGQRRTPRDSNTARTPAARGGSQLGAGRGTLSPAHPRLQGGRQRCP